MGAGISFFRWNRKRRLIQQSSSSTSGSNLNVSAVASEGFPESPVPQLVENVVSVQEIGNDQLDDGIRSAGLNLITDELSPSKYQLMNIIEITPRADEEMQSGVPDTPIGFEASVYKYYCPLCMLHFKRILKTQCCNNYICLSCCMEYLTSKGVERKKDIVSTINAAQFKLEKIHCPNCSTVGFQPFPVALDDLVRDYSRDNAEQRLISSKSVPHAYQVSPVRRGESFEDLKRKMIPYGGSSNLAGIADVATPVSESTEEANRRTEGGECGPSVPVVDEEEGPEVVRRLAFDDLAPDPVEADSRIDLNRNVNIVATSMISGIFANVVHK